MAVTSTAMTGERGWVCAAPALDHPPAVMRGRDPRINGGGCPQQWMAVTSTAMTGRRGGDPFTIVMRGRDPRINC